MLPCDARDIARSSRVNVPSHPRSVCSFTLGYLQCFQNRGLILSCNASDIARSNQGHQVLGGIDKLL
jgi:hypothetical protein